MHVCMGCATAELKLDCRVIADILLLLVVLPLLQDVFSLGCVITELWLDGRAFLWFFAAAGIQAC
jgi:hypothetical protein